MNHEQPVVGRERDRVEAALAAFARRGLAPRIRMELGSNEAIREAILAGAGVAVLPRHLLGAQPEPPGLVCLDVEGFPLESMLQFAWPVGKQLAPAARAFLDFARSQAEGPLPGAPAAVPARLQAIELQYT
ncbi:hypothetical protein GCM10028796_29850 [Ramlibacter monticola]|uniref:LysR substrate-binding domain-containing protein n=1 Tax=Ramlibacter monticola TaxID=1926872 RepID=A0A937CXZ4_9BURK|nr:LysR substrate-binding domain-containing protein [Ramlibacter monticola]MBL0394637.1 hypothetical protein [Ramlibacter monticola]